MNKLIFIRHGETDFNHKGLWMGCTDIELNANGRQQAVEAAKKLTATTIDVIYTSPLKRAYLTATIIAEHQITKPPIIVLDDLRERGFGILEGTPKFQSLDNNFDQIKNVETKIMLIKRLTKVFTGFQVDTNKNILIVSHGGIFHCLTRDMQYISSPSVDDSQISNCLPVVITQATI